MRIDYITNTVAWGTVKSQELNRQMTVSLQGLRAFLTTLHVTNILIIKK